MPFWWPLDFVFVASTSKSKSIFLFVLACSLLLQCFHEENGDGQCPIYFYGLLCGLWELLSYCKMGYLDANKTA